MDAEGGEFLAPGAFIQMEGTSRSGDAIIDSTMAQLLVRNLEDEVVNRLKVRAAERGISAEEEHRRILRAALLEPGNRSFAELLREIPDVGEDSDFERPLDLGRRVDL